MDVVGGIFKTGVAHIGGQEREHGIHILPFAHPTADALSGKGVPEVINPGSGTIKLGQTAHLKTLPKRFRRPNLGIGSCTVISREEKRAIRVDISNLFRVLPHYLKQIVSHNYGSVFMPFGLLNIEHTPHQVYILLPKQPGLGGTQATAVEQSIENRHHKMSGWCVFVGNK